MEISTFIVLIPPTPSMWQAFNCSRASERFTEFWQAAASLASSGLENQIQFSFLPALPPAQSSPCCTSLFCLPLRGVRHGSPPVPPHQLTLPHPLGFCLNFRETSHLGTTRSPHQGLTPTTLHFTESVCKDLFVRNP